MQMYLYPARRSLLFFSFISLSTGGSLISLSYISLNFEVFLTLLLYQFEYRSLSTPFPLLLASSPLGLRRVDYLNSNQEPAYTVCVVGANEGTLFTFASRVPAAVWAERADELREAAESFVLL